MREPVARVRRRERLIVGAAGAVALGAAALLAPSVAAAPAIGPNSLDAALSRLPTGTVVCNDQADGGWLMLRHPDLKPTMDTRVELYTVDRIRAYLAFMSAGPGWQSYPAEVQCTYAVLPTGAAVVPVLQATSGWQVVEQSGDYVLLRA
jgi:hypothetical protein